MVTQSVVLFVWIKQSTHAVFSLIFNLFQKSQTLPPPPASVFHNLCWTNLTVCCVYIYTQQKLISNCPLYTNINRNLNTLSQKTHDVRDISKAGSITAWGWKVHVSSHLKIYIMNELQHDTLTKETLWKGSFIWRPWGVFPHLGTRAALNNESALPVLSPYIILITSTSPPSVPSPSFFFLLCF